MTKQELENLIGYEIEEKDFEQLNKMYMACDLDKYEFAKMVKPSKKVQKVQLVRIIYGDHSTEVGEYVNTNIKSGKTLVKNARPEEFNDYKNVIITQYCDYVKVIA